MSDRYRVGANLATLANALLGVGAILYILAGNKLWAMLLVACAIGFDGLDGLLSRRSAAPPSRFGRVADSIADGITFGLAPAFLIAVHTGDVSAWAPYAPFALAVGAGYAACALARLTLFTVRTFERPYFLGVPTPESALAVIVAVLFHDTPAFQAVAPIGVLVGSTALAVLMLAPIPYPKIRRGSVLRVPMAATGVASALALVPLQFRPATGSGLYLLAEVAAYALLVGVALYYVAGPFTVRRPAAGPEGAG